MNEDALETTPQAASALSDEIVRAQPPSRRTAAELVRSMSGELAKALPKTLTVDRFVRLALTELRMNPKLGQCSSESLLGALMMAARLGLEPGGPLGQFYLTPRTLKGQGLTVVPIVGFQGLRDLAYRSGLVRSLDSILVRDGDHYSEGANEQRGHWYQWERAEGGSARPVTGVLAVAELADGGRVIRFMDRAEIDARRSRGAAGDSGPWKTDFDAMARKTGVRGLASLLPKSVELTVAATADETPQFYRIEAGSISAEIDAGPVEAVEP